MADQAQYQTVGLRGFLTLKLATFSEMTGLIIALMLVTENKPFAAMCVLVISQLSERLAVFLVAEESYGGRPYPRTMSGLVILSALVESAAWIIWLVLWDGLPLPRVASIAIATLAMFVMQLYSHSGTMAVVLNKPPLSRYASDGLTIAFSLIEALAAGAWLWVARMDRPVLAAVALFVGITIEHVIQSLALEKALPPRFLDEGAKPE
jgi:hypothetical protein